MCAHSTVRKKKCQLDATESVSHFVGHRVKRAKKSRSSALFRAMTGIGMPVSRILTFAMGMPGVRHFIEPFVVVLETCTDEPISSLFLRACARVVNKFGKVIYIMFFLVVHLMKLHSLSLIWGVTTEAMEYEESAEQRRAGARDRGANSGNDNDKRRPPLFPPSSAKPSMSSLRLKRLGFVGFGGTLGGILGR